MPGRGSYGPGGKWIYQRAKHIRSKNPDMDESTSFAIATQQAHKVGKSPKKFRTEEGVQAAKAKMRGPQELYKKTAGAVGVAGIGRKGRRLLRKAKKLPLRKPSGTESLSVLETVVHPESDNTKTAMLSGFFDELEKDAGLREGLKTLLTGRVPLYHGTSVGRARKIVKRGLKPQGASGISKRISNALALDLPEAEKGLAFTTRSKDVANRYALQQAGLERVDAAKGMVGKFLDKFSKHAPSSTTNYLNKANKALRTENEISSMVDTALARQLGRLPGKKKLVRMDVPRAKLKSVEGIGQELHKNPNLVLQREALKAKHPKAEQLTALPFIHDVPIKGGVGSEYIRGSKDYKRVSLDELKQHFRNVAQDPKEFGKDVLRSTLGVSHRPGTLLRQGA